MSKRINFFAVLFAVFFATTGTAQTWYETQPKGNVNANWRPVAMDNSYSKIIVGENAGRLYLYSSGSWAEVRPTGYDSSYSWISASMSGDGTKILVTALNRRLWLYSNGTWTEQRPAGDANKQWVPCAVSRDGSTMIAGAQNGRLYKYSGGSWSEIRPSGADANFVWNTAALSNDGSKIFVCTHGTTSGQGRLYYYNGSSWSEMQPAGNVDRQWRGLSMSGDGSVLVAAAYSGRLYISTNSGGTWSEPATPNQSSNKGWQVCSVSENGTYIIAGASTSPLWIYNAGSWTYSNVGGASKTFYGLAAGNAEKYLCPAFGSRFYMNYQFTTTSIKAVNSVTQATINKVNSVSKSNIKKINGVLNQ